MVPAAGLWLVGAIGVEMSAVESIRTIEHSYQPLISTLAGSRSVIFSYSSYKD